MPSAIVEKLWKIVDCRDQSLNAVHESLATQAVEKERQIARMAVALAEKEQEIMRLASALSDREDEIQGKEVEIGRLAMAASERLELIDRQHAELESINRSAEYRLGWFALNPWKVLKKRLFGNTNFR